MDHALKNPAMIRSESESENIYRMWWCDKGIQGDSDNYDGAANSYDPYDYAPAESEGDDDDDGGYDYAPAA
ncbi:hypothetical protein AgCh_006607 [Apium graveolens]